MIKGIVKIDNKKYKYTLNVVPYCDNREKGWYLIRYKHRSIFYNCVEVEEFGLNMYLKKIYYKLDNLTQDELNEFIINNIKLGIKYREQRIKYK